MSFLPRGRRACAAAVMTAGLLIPAATAAAATPANPAVVRINPTTGAATRIAGGNPWTTLGGIAFGPGGRLYVANRGPAGPRPKGAGIYSVGTAAGSAITRFANTDPLGLAASGSTLYSLGANRIVAMDTSGQRVLTSGGLYASLGVSPAYGAVSGDTLYTTASSSSPVAGGSYVIGVDTVTGEQTLVRSFGGTPLTGIAAAPKGTLLIAEGGRTPQIVELNPATGAMTVVSRGGLLKQPQGIARDAAGDLYVADAKAGVVAVSTQGGDQSPMTNTGVVVGASGIAVGSTGTIYVTAAGTAPQVKTTAAARQRFRTSGVRFTASGGRRYTVGYVASVKIAGGTGFAQSASFRNLSGRRTLRVQLPSQVNRRIARALRSGRTVTETLKLRPQDARTGARGPAQTLRVRLVNP
jgi:hypothetical protein